MLILLSALHHDPIDRPEHGGFFEGELADGVVGDDDEMRVLDSGRRIPTSQRDRLLEKGHLSNKIPGTTHNADDDMSVGRLRRYLQSTILQYIERIRLVPLMEELPIMEYVSVLAKYRQMLSFLGEEIIEEVGSFQGRHAYVYY